MIQPQIIKNEVLNEQFYFYKHPTGLGILLYPMEGFSSAYALFGTNYGSIDTTFKTQNDDDFLTVPEGIAHFLEHKLFESEDGDAFSLFAKTGASANAFTSFEKTCYLFSTTDNFEDSLKALVTFVQDPYFTKETVEKEQGIIGQEIKMYEDDPSWRVFFNLLSALYKNHPVRIDIAGTVESIAEIDKDLLYRCYNTFYNLNNMVICIAGNFDYEKAIQIIDSNLKDNKKIEIERKLVEEPKEVNQKEFIQELSVGLPLFNIGYKEVPAKDDKDELYKQIAYTMILKIIAGKSSDLYKKLYDSSLINSSFSTEVFCGRGYLANIFAGESRKPKEVLKEIKNAVEEYKNKLIDKESFDRIKKALFGQTLLGFNSVEDLANDMVSAYFSNRSVYDSIDIIKDITLDDLNNLLLNSFNSDALAISIVNPIK